MQKMLDLRDALQPLVETYRIGFEQSLIEKRREFREYWVPKDIALAASGGKLPLIFVNITYEVASGFDVSLLEEIEQRFGLIYAGEVDTSNEYSMKRPPRT
jgi:hypothetical protein